MYSSQSSKTENKESYFTKKKKKNRKNSVFLNSQINKLINSQSKINTLLLDSYIRNAQGYTHRHARTFTFLLHMKHLKPLLTRFYLPRYVFELCGSLLQKYKSVEVLFVPWLRQKWHLVTSWRDHTTFCRFLSLFFFAGSIALGNTFWSSSQMVLVTESLMEATLFFASGFPYTAFAHVIEINV